jgi:hypothetical protein
MVYKKKRVKAVKSHRVARLPHFLNNLQIGGGEVVGLTHRDLQA